MFYRFGAVKEKPTAVADYNQYMLGMDKSDQLSSYYSFLHKRVKWWRKVFFYFRGQCGKFLHHLQGASQIKRRSPNDSLVLPTTSDSFPFGAHSY